MINPPNLQATHSDQVVPARPSSSSSGIPLEESTFDQTEMATSRVTDAFALRNGSPVLLEDERFECDGEDLEDDGMDSSSCKDSAMSDLWIGQDVEILKAMITACFFGYTRNQNLAAVGNRGSATVEMLRRKRSPCGL
ncbi:unnamed protein product [Cyprideis torosa]|uniref:Uncharacterized protein n=1 Tax=Cyprideis torosa TaxID=163714 RepID=A0A7R8ZRT2_9CRUS|nr:unnamed protein product [Cyprideis torosa]CAG0894735.1 unnamed protein product [Cyprideis torosa]